MGVIYKILEGMETIHKILEGIFNETTDIATSLLGPFIGLLIGAFAAFFVWTMIFIVPGVLIFGLIANLIENHKKD